MKLTCVLNNEQTCVLLIPETEIERDILKQINGATCATIKENLSVLSQSVSEGIIIKIEKVKSALEKRNDDEFPIN